MSVKIEGGSMRAFNVDGCAKCPFGEESGWATVKCSQADDRETLAIHEDGGLPPPEWCPLRTEPVLLRVKGQN